MFTENIDLVLEIADLINYNEFTHDIEVDKSIFDDFIPNTLIYIQFVEDEDNCVREYVMTEETDDGIKMEYLC